MVGSYAVYCMYYRHFMYCGKLAPAHVLRFSTAGPEPFALARLVFLALETLRVPAFVATGVRWHLYTYYAYYMYYM